MRTGGVKSARSRPISGKAARRANKANSPSGTVAIQEVGTFERRQRDLTTAPRRFAMWPQNRTILRRVQLGQDTSTTRFGNDVLLIATEI
jgi:hypothetical protein